jgi:signal transduction histidine kinase
MAVDWTRLENEVREMGTVVESVVATVRTVAEALRNIELRDAADQAKVNAFADQLDSQASTLANAVKESTPAAPEPAPATPVVDIPPVEGVVTEG